MMLKRDVPTRAVRLVLGAFSVILKGHSPVRQKKKMASKSGQDGFLPYNIQPQEMRRVEEFYHMISVSH